jgi:hypothetical protein
MKLQHCKHAAPDSDVEQLQIVWRQWARGRWYPRTTTLDASDLLATCVELDLDPQRLLWGDLPALREAVMFLEEPDRGGASVLSVSLLVAGRPVFPATGRHHG